MKIPLLLVGLIALTASSFAAPTTSSVKGKTLKEVNLISPRVLKRSVSDKFYKTLLVSPIEGLIVVRAQISGSKLFGERIVRSDLDGRFDKVALQTARDLNISGDYHLDSQIKFSAVRLNVLIYEIADGTMALYNVTLERAGGEQVDYYGSAKLAVLKGDGSWTEITGPANLRNMALRDPSGRNNLKAQLKMEMIESAQAQGSR